MIIITNVWGENDRYVGVDFYLRSGSILNELKEGTMILDNTLSLLNITNLNKNDLRILRNAIYAKYGYIFRSIDLNEYFIKFSWYKSEYINVDNRLTEIDKNNIFLIQRVENNYPENSNEFIGVWWNPPYDKRFAVSAEGPDEIRIFPNGIFTGYGGLGLWNYKNNILRLNDEVIVFEEKYIVQEMKIGKIFFFNGNFWWKFKDNPSW